MKYWRKIFSSKPVNCTDTWHWNKYTINARKVLYIDTGKRMTQYSKNKIKLVRETPQSTKGTTFKLFRKLLKLFIFVIIASLSVGSYLVWLIWLILQFCRYFSKWNFIFCRCKELNFFVIRELTFQTKVYSRMITIIFSKLFTALKRLQTVSCSKIIGSD